ncbi:class I SAM-dependent methyltransferase [Martelella lutilitoris]|uniref:Class I SAM-dependent methyltransferase n=1 Tax=Martelella lutilitoris TaxID=2583532 RepID=A0A7T7HKG1_9HYPH|nr:class I SAM-dependent methyltransferase [Martelella lutilitoris]QQM30834.1 class I SAM-dependent methyltransferase [Martelella lutilitoris]
MAADKKKFWDKIAEKYSRDPIADPQSYQIKLDITREYFQPDMRVLEIGCGTGSTALYHAPAVARIDAFDLSDTMIAIAKRKAEDAAATNVHFHQGDVTAMNGSDGLYDAVMAHSLLHLLEDRERVLEKVHAMLKPGGVFISSTACLRDFSFYIKAAIPVMQLIGKAPYVGSFTQEELINEMARAGFSVVHQWRPGKNKATFLVATKAL